MLFFNGSLKSLQHGLAHLNAHEDSGEDFIAQSSFVGYTVGRVPAAKLVDDWMEKGRKCLLQATRMDEAEIPTFSSARVHERRQSSNSNNSDNNINSFVGSAGDMMMVENPHVPPLPTTTSSIAAAAAAAAVAAAMMGGGMQFPSHSLRIEERNNEISSSSSSASKRPKRARVHFDASVKDVEEENHHDLLGIYHSHQATHVDPLDHTEGLNTGVYHHQEDMMTDGLHILGGDQTSAPPVAAASAAAAAAVAAASSLMDSVAGKRKAPEEHVDEFGHTSKNGGGGGESNHQDHHHDDEDDEFNHLEEIEFGDEEEEEEAAEEDDDEGEEQHTTPPPAPEEEPEVVTVTPIPDRVRATTITVVAALNQVVDLYSLASYYPGCVIFDRRSKALDGKVDSSKRRTTFSHSNQATVEFRIKNGKISSSGGSNNSDTPTTTTTTTSEEREVCIHINVFANGRLTITGSRSEEQAMAVLGELIKRMKKSKGEVGQAVNSPDTLAYKDFRTVMIKCDFSFGIRLNIERTSTLLADHFELVRYEPQSYPGVIVSVPVPQIKSKPFTVIIYASGKVCVSGSNGCDNIRTAFSKVHQIIVDNLDIVKGRPISKKKPKSAEPTGLNRYIGSKKRREQRQNLLFLLNGGKKMVEEEIEGTKSSGSK